LRQNKRKKKRGAEKYKDSHKEGPERRRSPRFPRGGKKGGAAACKTGESEKSQGKEPTGMRFPEKKKKRVQIRERPAREKGVQKEASYLGILESGGKGGAAPC